VSPILVRPVREQLEHDRLIRHLLVKYKRKFEVVANLGDEQLNPVKIGSHTFFPDLVLTTASKKLAGVIEVETGESVNNLEAMAQWVHFARSRVPFHLYVPVHGYDAARRLCEAHHARVSEIWTYRSLLDDFDLVKVASDPSAQHARLASKSPAKPAGKPSRAAKPAQKPAPARATTKGGGVAKNSKAAASAKRPTSVVRKPAAKAKPAANHTKNNKKKR
jgi:hypothetical protein